MSVYLTISGAKNGINQTFTLNAIPTGLFRWNRNGSIQTPGQDYTILLNIVTCYGVAIPQASDSLLAIAEGSIPIPSSRPTNLNRAPAATIRVRALNQNSDPMRGNGQGNFLSDVDAVGAIVSQRLQLLKGEWWENISLGLPLFQSILGQANTTQAVALILRQNILGSPYVTGIQSLQLAYGPKGRMYTFSAVVQTAFGPVTISNDLGAIDPNLTWQSQIGRPWSQYDSVGWIR